MRLSGAEILARILIEQGVDTIFGYPGAAVLPIYDALFDHRDKITHYITAHEQGATHAADGYARSTGKVGVVLATSGPGSTNIVTGVATAFMDSSPLVVITGNVATPYIGKDSFQEVYTTGITLPITKHNFSVQDVRLLAPTLREAFAIAISGRRGPVLVDITKDAQAAWCEFEPEQQDEPVSSGRPLRYAGTQVCFSQTEVEAALERLSASSKPLVIFGGGVISANASAELYEFIRATRIPATHSIMGIGALDVDDPLNLGLVGMHGRRSGNITLGEADLILALGFRFSDRVALNTENWAQKAYIIQVDIDQSEVDKNVAVDQAIIGDVRDVLRAMLEAIQSRGSLGGLGADYSSWHEQISRWRASDLMPPDDDAKLMPHQVIQAICEAAGDTVIFTTDVGQHQMWAAQYCGRMQPRSFITSGGLGAMGFGYGAAIGAQIGTAGLTERRRPVVHVTGDGSFHMNLNEACTAVSYRLPIITVIFNNQVLGMVRQWQKNFYDERYSATTLDRATDYVKLAEAFGLVGKRAATIAEFKAAFSEALVVDGPVWIECVIDRDEQVFPMIPSGGTFEDTIVV